ncbi:methylamine utilization protein [Methylibium petroleiphilum]|uniref:methylamine utilization protein n=1 Tax=Methylibium petroleiphilum TaxID=105560 RepID=UPI001AD02F2D|nr:methylamine utilization protein [Methylibium petroleiphilum]MBN9204994.1 methylamine utilization protein [Methylibium petroleiphilum]
MKPLPLRHRSSCRFLALVLLLAGLPAHAVPLVITVTDEQGAPLADAVVAVQVKGTPPNAPAGASAELGQKNRRFTPSVLAVQTGTAVNFPNFDTVRHHVYSFSPIKTFELKLYAGTPAAPVVFDKPGIAVLGCNIHDAMTAYVRVVDTPYFARTDSAGRAQLELPAGDHQLQTWHALLGIDAVAPVQPLKVGSAPAAAAVKLNAKAP